MAKKSSSAVVARDEAQTSNAAEPLIEMNTPYIAEVQIVGVVPILFHAWNTESVEEKAAAPKNSKTKKTDDVESYVYRDANGYLGIAGKCMHGAIVNAAKSFADPRSPRKSAADLCKAGVQVVSLVALLEPKTKKWDYDDRQRVVIQRSAITRTRPAMKEGWTVTFMIQVSTPEYISPQFLHDIIDRAGKLSGLCDYRPSYGRFRVTKFSVIELT